MIKQKINNSNYLYYSINISNFKILIFLLEKNIYAKLSFEKSRILGYKIKPNQNIERREKISI